MSYQNNKYKINKYIHKMSNIDINDSKFSLYLSKLNYWYNQYGNGLLDKYKYI